MRVRLVALVLCLAGPLGSGVASATSRLFVSASNGAGPLASFGDADGTFTAAPQNGGLDFFFAAQTRFFEFRMTFISGDGSLPAPGTYEGVEDANLHGPDGHPQIFMTVTDGDYCSGFGGSFVVHELVAPGAVDVLAFSAEYVLTCLDGTTRFGTVLFRVGDPTCVDVPDGTPCDDGNACTVDDACEAGRCTGEDVVTPRCLIAAQCTQPFVCYPPVGICVTASVAAGTPCDDGDPATAYDECRDDE